MPLTEVEAAIAKTVVERFFRMKESSPRKLLIIRFRSPEALYRLSNAAVLRSFGSTDQDQVFLPCTLAFHYCGDQDIIRIARTSVEIVLYVLQNMFDVETEKAEFTPSDVEAHARKMYDVVDPENVKLGLYLVRDFAALGGWGMNAAQTELTSLRIAENIVTIKDVSKEWDAYIQRSTVFDRIPDERRLNEFLPVSQSSEQRPPTHSGLWVFISHSSKDADLALALIDLLKGALGLTADKIRCSSVDGYRLPVGINTEGKLREEVNAAKIVVGLITPNSLSSYYVMFELGARWGANLFVAPLLAGVKPNELSGPLSLLNALSANNEAQLHQLIDDIADQLGLPLQNAASYIRNISAVKALADAVVSPKAKAATTAVPAQKLGVTVSAEGDPPSQVFKVVANQRVTVSRVEYMLSSDATVAGEEILKEGESIEIPVNDSLLLKLWNTPRADRNHHDHSGPAKIGLTISADGYDAEQYVLPVQMESFVQNSTNFRKLVGSKTFHQRI